jgi:hypothetical protein
MRKYVRLGGLLTIAALILSAAPVFAQGGGGGGGGRGQQMTPEEIREFQLQGIQEALVGTTDEQWAVIQPLLGKVLDASQKVQGYATGGRGGRGGRGNRAGRTGGRGFGGAEPAAELAALQTTLADEAAAAPDITAKLKAYRDARKKAQDDLTAARAELTKVLSPKQEAQLVLAGQLE